MEKFENMQQNKISDEELGEITGGKGIFDIFTADFRGKAQNPTTLELNLDEDADNHFTVSTLEMRANLTEPQDTKKTRKVIKL